MILDSDDKTNTFHLISSESSGDQIASKFVFRGIDKGVNATFETGSFLELDELGQPKWHHICVSTAGGCTRRCTFCATTTSPLGFERLLTSTEIVGQVEYSRDLRDPHRTYGEIVGFMGNGEPPDNPHLLTAISKLVEDPTPPNKILVSTIGENIRGLRRLVDALWQCPVPVVFYLSLHTADDRKRRAFIPGRRSIEDIMAVLDEYADRAYNSVSNTFPVRINVTLMQDSSRGINNYSEDDALGVVELVSSPSRYSGDAPHRKLKLSSFNSVPGISFCSPPGEARAAYLSVLFRSGIPFYEFSGDMTSISDDGRQGGYACGQLRATTAKIVGTGGTTPES